MEDDLRLALALHRGRGAYALMLGSGVSRGAGIPTAWEVVSDLIQSLAAMKGETPDNPTTWFEKKYGRSATYSDLLEEVAKTSTERMKLLEGYFDRRSDDDPTVGSPTPAHRAVAKLVKLGFIKVIIETNFDHLTELALKDEGIAPVVIRSNADAAKAAPYWLRDCLLIKAHGDYLDTGIRNTPAELADLGPEMTSLLARIFEELGVLTVGWSGEWDTGLRTILIDNPSPSFSTFVTARRDPSAVIEEILAARSGSSILIRDADTFMVELLDRVTSLNDLGGGGLIESAMAGATAKRLIGRDAERIRLNDLIWTEAERAKTVIAQLPVGGTEPTTWEDVKTRTLKISEATSNLSSVAGVVGYWGAADHGEMLLRAVRLLTRWPIEGGNALLLDLRKLGAMLPFYAAGVAAVAAGNYSTLAPLTSAKLKWGSEPERFMASALNVANLDDRAINSVLTIDLAERKSFYTPQSQFMADLLAEHLRAVVPDREDYLLAFDRWEYLLAMLYWRERRAWVPLGSFAWRNHRSMVGGGVPADIASELEANASQWAPVKAGILTVDEALEAQELVKKIMEESRWNFT